MGATSGEPRNRLVLRAVLKEVSPIVARVISVPDDLEISDLHDVFLSLLGWASDPGFIVRVHAQEFNSFQRKSRGKRLRDFWLRRQEKFLYICDTLDLWEWEVRVLDVAPAEAGDIDVMCLQGRGAAPPEGCGGPRGYRLMLKRQEGSAISDPDAISASVELLSAAYPNETINWQLLEEVVNDGWRSIEQRLERSGPLTPMRFSLKETNERLALLMQRGSVWR
ncbi:MAG: IS1096 element passenger TnpR family protein [Geminicoccaceae bacterium]